MDCPNCTLYCEETLSCDDCGKDGCPDCIISVKGTFAFCQECRLAAEKEEKEAR